MDEALQKVRKVASDAYLLQFVAFTILPKTGSASWKSKDVG